MTLQEAALVWADRGWRVFPCLASGAPATRNGFHDASDDPEVIAAWAWRGRRLGGVPGSAGLVVLDVDAKAGTTLADIPAELLDTRRHRTKSGGWHLVYTARDGATYGNGARLDIAAGVDIRHLDGYVILPPSPGYELDRDVEPLEAPAVLELAVVEARRPELIERGVPIPRGVQDRELFGLALRLWEDGLDLPGVVAGLWSTIETRCLDQDKRNPWRPADAERIARSASTRHDRLVASVNSRPRVHDEPDEPDGITFSTLVGLEMKTAEPYGARLNIPRGTIAILTGQQGTGKGLLAVAEAATISRDVGGVIFASEEDAAAYTIKPRLVAAGANLERVYMPSSLRLPEDLEQLVAFALEHEVRLVIVDPWTNHLGEKIDVNSSEVRPPLMALKAACELANFAAILVAHPNKNSQNPDPLERVAHASALTQVARSAFWIVRDPWPIAATPLNPRGAEDYRLVAQVKQNLTERAATLAYKIETADVGLPKRAPVLEYQHEHDADWLEIHRQAAESMRARPDKAPAALDAWTWLRDYLEANGPMPYGSVLAAALEDGVTKSTLESAQRDAIKRGDMIAAPRKPWQLAPRFDLAD